MGEGLVEVGAGEGLVEVGGWDRGEQAPFVML